MEQLTITTLPQVRAYLAEIPADKWCHYTRDSRKGQHCALGHLDKVLKEPIVPGSRILVSDPVLVRITDDPTFPMFLVAANNNASDPKQGSLEFIDKYIKAHKVA